MKVDIKSSSSLQHGGGHQVLVLLQHGGGYQVLVLQAVLLKGSARNLVYDLRRQTTYLPMPRSFRSLD